MTDPQPDREMAEAWRRFSLATDEQIQAQLREFADIWGRSVDEFAAGLRVLADCGVALSEIEEARDAA